MDVSCQCGAVAFKTGTPAPLAIYFCHCTQCRLQSASAFGVSATFPARAIPLFPDADAYSDALRASVDVFSRPGNAGRTVDCYFCRRCGSRIAHRRRGADGTPQDTANVKGGLINGLDMRHPVHIWAKEAVVPIPEGATRYAESPPPP